jgi:indolepyruvate ferredoxin oxidoreductase
MTGGQAIDGELSIPSLVQQLAAEGVKHIAIVSDDTQLNNNMATFSNLAAEVKAHPREEFDRVQTALREVKGVSVLIYDQMCATEKRRQIKRGKLPDTKTFAYINADVCEDCGDCSRKSNCLAVVPRDTAMGRKRRIDQAACNHDYSCMDGFCPSFVSIEGTRKSANTMLNPADTGALKEPDLPELDRPYALVITGVGGTGIVTLSAILGVAAHIDGKGINVLDMTGLAQKFGAVSSHVQIAAHSEDLHAARIAAGQADLLLGCDAITAGSDDVLAKLDPQRSRAVLNDHATITSDYIQNPDTPFPAQEIRSLISESVLPGKAWFFDSTRIAERACGNPIASNMLMVGYAWQKGLIPLSRNAIERAIEINHVAIEMNLQAFNWGRCLADDTPKVIEQLNLMPAAEPTLDEVIELRANALIEYQDQELSQRYVTKIERLRARESGLSNRDELSRVAAQQYARLLMIKDEFEVARLLSGEPFKAELDAQFEPGYTVRYHLAPPLLSRPVKNHGNPAKMSFGAWLNPVLRFLSAQRTKRNTWLDPFRFSAERKADLALVQAYEELVGFVIDNLQTENREEMLKQLTMAEQTKGFGQMRQQKAEELRAKWVAYRSIKPRP